MALVLVGATALKRSGPSAGYQSITFNRSDLPADTRVGDRLICVVDVFVAVNTVSINRSAPADWTSDTDGGNGGTAAGSAAYRAFGGRYGLTAFPATFYDLGNPGFTNTARAIILVYRDSRSYTSSFAGSYGGDTATIVPATWPTSHTVTADAILIAVQHTITGTITGVSAANGFTERVNDSGLIIADRVVNTPGTYAPPKWTRTPNGSFDRHGYAYSAMYSTVDPPVVGWRIGSLRGFDRPGF